MAFAAYSHAYGVLAGATLILALASWSLGGIWRWTALVAYPLAFLASQVLLMPGQTKIHTDPLELLGAVLILAGVSWITLREQGARNELAWQQNIIDALRVGSERLNEARDAEGIIKAGVNILEKLDIAPNIGFVAYRQGTPYILSATGVFKEYMERPIQPSDNDSRSVQADHWVAEEALTMLNREDRRKYLVTPVYGRSSAHLGVLILTRPDNVEFDEQEKSVIASFARLLGAQLGQWHAIRDLRDANELTLKALGGALERRDDETGGHTQRVVNTSMRLARKLGWDEEQVKSLRWGAYLHDLGKIAIPDGILHKPAPLTPEERKVIQTHATIGYDLLQDLHFLPAETLDLVRYHHERWDGTGYPAGLRGQNIPDTARIFTIVDVYDALTNARPYKSAWPRERALQEIRSQAGKQFDPHYVDAFLRMMNDNDEAKLIV